MRINIVGGGPAGLFFALLMKKLDSQHEVAVYERDPANNTYGWGIVLSERSLGTLRGADFEVYSRLIQSAELWKTVEVVHAGERISIGGNEFSGVGRMGFLQLLHRRCESLGVRLEFETAVDGVGPLSECDLLVGADGLQSTVREAVAEGFEPLIRERPNHYIWYGTPRPFQGLTMVFRRHPDGLYIAHAYRFQPELSTFIVECDPATWRRAGFAARSEAETAAYLAEVFHDELGGAPLLSNRSVWYNFLLVRNRNWHHRNIVLLGDALHSVHFSIGSGTALAVEDAIALAGSLAEEDTVPAALEAFERLRKPRVDALQDAAMDSLSWLENVQPDLDLHPLPFAFKLMTRSNRVSYRRLKQQDPAFVADYETWRWQNEGPIHKEFLDLFQKKAYGHLASLLADGRPHVTPVYADYDGRYILINSTKGRQKDLNMERRRKVSLEIPDPDQPLRYLGIQGEVVEITEEGAEEHLDRLAQRYHGRERYPASWKFPREVRRIYKIRPDKVIHWDPFGGW